MKPAVRPIVLFLALSATVSCLFYEHATRDSPEFKFVPSRPQIRMHGRAKDTAYLYSEYHDPGAVYANGSVAIENCSRYYVAAHADGTVNTHITGTYFITYAATDSLGQPLAPVTRTVQVIESKVGFLNGIYNVAFNGTVTSRATKTTSIVAGTYTALVKTNGSNRCFDIYTLNLGSEMLGVGGCLWEDSLDLGFWTPDYLKTDLVGNMSTSRNTFTVESTVYPYAVNSVYRFQNVFTKQFIISSLPLQHH